MIAHDWSELLTLTLLGAGLLALGLIVGWVVRAAQARRKRHLDGK